jgi:N-acetylglutamate synthase-like GNAT family acetyltransferase
MNIFDLTPEHEQLYFVCLEDWSDEMAEAGDHKARWYERMKEKGLRVKLAADDEGNIGGMIQYIPIEHSFVEGEDMNVILCIWVHGYKEGRGDFTGKGMGKALLKAAEEDTKAAGKKGLVAWGVTVPFFMRASWFRKQEYIKVDKDGITALLWKPFSPDAVKPSLILKKKKPGKGKDAVNVDAFISGWCPASNIVFERAKKASAKFGEKVDFIIHDTVDSDVFNEWGIKDALFVNGKEVNTGPPPSYEKIRGIIEKQVKRLRK